MATLRDSAHYRNYTEQEEAMMDSGEVVKKKKRYQGHYIGEVDKDPDTDFPIGRVNRIPGEKRLRRI